MSQQCVALHVDCCYRLVALPKLNLSLEQGLERSGRSGSWANAGVCESASCLQPLTVGCRGCTRDIEGGKVVEAAGGTHVHEGLRLVTV